MSTRPNRKVAASLSMRSLAGAGLSMAGLAIVGLGLSAPDVASGGGIDEPTLERIEAIVTEAAEDPAAVGISVAIGVGGRLIESYAAGLADVELEAPAAADTVYRIGSVTKPLTAALVLDLVERGEIGLDDDITGYVDFPTGEHVVTVRHLLNHTSGIVSYTNVPAFWMTGAMRDLEPDELLAYVRDMPFEFEPGEEFNYNNTGYYLLGLLIEDVTGQSYDEHLRERFTGPLGLSRTRYDDPEAVMAGRAQGYQLVGEEIRPAMELAMRNPGAAGGLVSTAEDLVRWQMALAAGEVIGRDSYEMMITPTELPDGSAANYGFGYVIGSLESFDMVQHGGGVHGFTAMLLHIPERDLHIAVLSNSQSYAAGPLAFRIARTALGLADDEPGDEPVPAGMIEQIAGRYVIEAINLPIRFFERGGKLAAQAQGQPVVELRHEGEGVFRASFDPTLRIAFDLPDDGAAAESFDFEQQGIESRGTRVDEPADSPDDPDSDEEDPDEEDPDGGAPDEKERT